MKKKIPKHKTQQKSQKTNPERPSSGLFELVFSRVNPWMLFLTDSSSTLTGFNRCAGRVSLSNGTRVCSDGWNQRSAEVVCAELKCGAAVGVGRSSFGSGSGNNWLKVVACGKEKTLGECTSVFGSNCSQSDAGVVCSGECGFSSNCSCSQQNPFVFLPFFELFHDAPPNKNMIKGHFLSTSCQ